VYGCVCFSRLLAFKKTHTCQCTQTNKHACPLLYTHPHAHPHIHTHAHTHTTTHTHTYSVAHACVCACAFVRACVRAHTRVCVKWNIHKSWYYRSLDCVRIYIWPSDCMHIYEIIFTPYVTSICCITHIYNMHAVCVHTNIRINLCCPPPSGTQQRKAQDSLVTKEKNASNHSPK